MDGGDNPFKMLQRGALVVVPRPVEWAQIVFKTHRGVGHFRIQRVLDRLQKNNGGEVCRMRFYRT